jgi:hypothetical protein
MDCKTKSYKEIISERLINFATKIFLNINV